MKVQYLGSGDAFGSGGRLQTCILIEFDGLRFLVDYGASSLISLKRASVNPNDLKHLGLWDLKVRPPPKAKAPSVTISIDDSDSQVPFSAPPFYPDPEYPVDSYVS